MHKESIQAITTNLKFPPQKKKLRHPTLGSFVNKGLREPYTSPKLKTPILACPKQFMHKQNMCKTIHENQE